MIRVLYNSPEKLSLLVSLIVVLAYTLDVLTSTIADKVGRITSSLSGKATASNFGVRKVIWIDYSGTPVMQSQFATCIQLRLNSRIMLMFVKLLTVAIVVCMKLTKNTFIQNLKDVSSPWQTILLVTVAALAYLIRAWAYFIKPQLYAEDGVLWLADGHNKPVTGLFKPEGGFFHITERLFGFMAIHLPLLWAPTIFTMTGWALFIVMVYYLLSSRTKILTNNFERVSMVLTLCLIANFNEFFFNFSNSIFLLGIIGALIIVTKRPKNRIGSLVEKALYIISCLTLPFVWFYLILTLVDRFKYKVKNNFFLITALVASTAQGVCYLLTHVNRSPITLLSLFSPWTLLELYNQMIIPALRFARIDIPVSEFSTTHYSVLVVLLTVSAVAIAAIAVLRRSNKQFWFLFFFLAAMTLASIKSPSVNVPTPIEALKIMSTVKDGNRYFVYGIVAVNLIFIKSAYQVLKPRVLYIFIIFFFAFGLLSSIHYKALFVNKGWTDHTAAYRQGVAEFYSDNFKHQVIIPVNPDNWKMAFDK